MTAASTANSIANGGSPRSSDHCSDQPGRLTGTSRLAHNYADVLGVNVSAINMQEAVETATQWIGCGEPGYVCVSSVHVIMEAQREPKVLHTLNDAMMNTPDGMPLTWVGRLQGHRHMDRVFGPEFMLEMCRVSAKYGYRHFLYGGKPGVAEELKERLENSFPGIEVVGTSQGVHRSFSADEEQALIRHIRDARPHIVWVGLGAPFQELFMAQYVDRLKAPLMVGVGAAFDFHTGRVQDAPRWVKRAGLQWLHRLVQEPRRLWRRYLFSISGFLWHIALQFCRPSRRKEASA
jgi:N-acetylglucosaminyldiphosphoundecaprenol N-acetyl-beta-D-mannosaminyltransferase